MNKSLVFQSKVVMPLLKMEEDWLEDHMTNEVPDSIIVVCGLCFGANSHGVRSCLPPPTSGGHGSQQDQSEVETPLPEWNQDTTQWLPW